MLPSSTPEDFCISGSWEHQRKVWSTKQLQLCYLLAIMYQEGKQVLEIKWQNMQSKIGKKGGFFEPTCFTSLDTEVGRGKEWRKGSWKQGEKAQYLYCLESVIYPNKINRRIMYFRVWSWDVISCTFSKLSSRKANLVSGRCRANHGRLSSHLANKIYGVLMLVSPKPSNEPGREGYELQGQIV